MREIAARVVRSRPDRVVLISPHSPRLPDRMSAWAGRHRGDLSRFGAAEVTADLPDAPEVAASLGLPPILSTQPLDHGAMVPLAFLVEAGWTGPTAILALPWREDVASGEALAGLPGRTAVIASGDMSHRLRPGAPAGYHPQAAAFDASFVAALRADDWAAAVAAEPRELAAEDVVASTRLAMQAVRGPMQAEVLSYEGPWGVGYAEAILYDMAPPPWAIARQALRAAVEGRPYRPTTGGAPAGVFVTLHQRGELRGCIGHMQPTRASLDEEIAAVAVHSGLNDPRFPPVTAGDLADLDIEVSVLEPPEPCQVGDLDPAVFGIVVSAGRRRGVLLPGLEGVDTVAQQINAVRRKASIPDDMPVELQRFRVRKEAPP